MMLKTMVAGSRSRATVSEDLGVVQTSMKVAPREGLEPSTCRLGGGRAIQLCHRSCVLDYALGVSPEQLTMEFCG